MQLTEDLTILENESKNEYENEHKSEDKDK